MPHAWILAEISIFGIKAPGFIWLASVFLVAWALITGAWLLWRVTTLVRPMRAATNQLQNLDVRGGDEPGGGLGERQYERVRQALSGGTRSRLWGAIVRSLIRRRTLDGRDEYWIPESASDWAVGSVSEQTQFNRGYYAAFPGLLTGCGLFLTFLAILFALMGVSSNEQTHVVQGVNQLINGLSGKFLSSVVALFLALLFTLWERHLTHVLERTEAGVKAAVERLFPRLTSAYLLSEIQQGTDLLMKK